MKAIQDMDITGKRVLVRVDFNVPLDEFKNITDDTRIKAVLPTLRYGLDHDAKLIVASHLDRPGGKVVPELSLAPVAKRLGRFLNKNVIMAPDCVGEGVQNIITGMKPGDMVLLENLRFHPGEQKNDPEFAKALAALCDVFVNDAFAVSHRVNASVCAITEFVADSAAGFLLQGELAYFKKVMENPARPLVAIVGGAKVSSKLAALKNLLKHVNKLIIGGAMANTFLLAAGHSVGKSRVEKDLVDSAAEVLLEAKSRGIQCYLPVDAVVAAAKDAAAEKRIVPVQEIPGDFMVLDIGPATIQVFEAALKGAGTIVWNGPMGVFELEPFSKGTLSMVEKVAESGALSIVGGGDTDVAVHRAGESERITYISTGGGAFLALLEGTRLPALAALDEAQRRHRSS
jgi:phosphoglycerate kinase